MKIKTPVTAMQCFAASDLPLYLCHLYYINVYFQYSIYISFCKNYELYPFNKYKYYSIM